MPTRSTSVSLPPVAILAPWLAASLATRATPDRLHEGLPAAVLLLLYDRAEAPHLVLTKRPDTLAHHPGQVSLPGGRWEEGDGDLGMTALRETEEELGIPPAGIRLLGQLEDTPTVASNFVVRPFVGVSDTQISPVPNDIEIARVMEVPVASILAADAALPPVPDVLSLRYPLLGEDVWGATARILRTFSAVLRDALARGG